MWYFEKKILQMNWTLYYEINVCDILKECVKNELNFIVSNHNSDLSDLPKGFKFICSKWTFRKKLRPEPTIDKYKARILMRSFNQ